MSMHFADRLLAAIEEKGSPACVGIDPVYERLPAPLRERFGNDRIGALGEFCRQVLQVVHPAVPAVKPQIAYFEMHGEKGLGLYDQVVRIARELGLLTIGDVKRGDIGPTAKAYAEGHLGGSRAPDAVTLNGYFGADGLAPFVDACREKDKGMFVLVRTSNPSAAVIQDFADASGRKFYEHIAEQVAAIGGGEGLVGESGYSCVGAVVGATYPDEARRLREIMPRQMFLVPGYGAQGATAADCAAAFRPDGTGAIVNAGRSVIYAYEKQARTDWKQAIESAARAFAKDIAEGVR